MINSAQHYPLTQILGTEQYIKYEIPKYQREYIWSREDWEFLFDDLTDNENGYFLGSIICIPKQRENAFDVQKLEIIDGQQRLTTLSLLYAAIYEALNSLDRDDDDFITTKNNIKYKIVQQRHNDKLKISLSSQNNNFDDYKSILKDIGLYDERNFETPAYFGLRRINKTFNYFKDRISDYSYEELIELLDKVNSSILVKIEVNNHADAFTLFESLNNRGVPLSAMDLIKNKFLSEFESTNPGSIDEKYDEWLTLLDNLTDDYKIQERFLRQYYNAFRFNTDIKVRNVPKVTRSNLIRTYNTLIDQDVNRIFEDLIKKSEIYNIFVSPPQEGEYNQFYDGLKDLLYVGAAPAYTILLYLFSNHNDKTDLIKDTITFLTKYFTRRNLTDYPNTRDLDTIFIGLVDECENNLNDLELDTIINYLRNEERFANDDLFKQKLNADIYELNTMVTRFILSKIEQSYQTRENFSDLWKRNRNNKFIFSIEHIFPAGKNIPSDWVSMIADGDPELAAEYQERYVHKLGNLTLTAYNSQLSNFSFTRKRDRQDQNDNYIGYKNGMWLNNNLKDLQSWKVDNIEERTELLVNKALEIFSI